MKITLKSALLGAFLSFLTLLGADQPGAWPQALSGLDGLGISLHLRGELNPEDYSVLKPIAEDDLNRQLDQMADLGVKVIRTDLAWNQVEGETDQYDFSAHRRLLAACKKRNMWLLTILSKRDTTAGILGIGSPEGERAFLALCTQAAAAFAGEPVIWELWNEPNLGGFWNPAANPEQYAGFMKKALAGMRQADPDCVIVAPSTCTVDEKFLTACAEAGLFEHVSAVGIHPYSDDPETQISRYLWLRNLLIDQTSNGTVPLVTTEWGYSEVFVGTGTRLRTEEEKAALLARSVLVDLISGFPMHIMYTNYDYNEEREWNESAFGLIRSDRVTPKPAYFAIRNLIERLRGLRFAARRTIGDPQLAEVSASDYAVVFRDDGREVMVFWSTAPGHEVKTAIPQGTMVACYDLFGNDLPLPKPTAAADAILLEIGPHPIFLEIKL